MKKKPKRRFLVPAGVCLAVVAAAVYYYFFASMLGGKETKYVYIDSDDTVDSVSVKLSAVSKSNAITGFKTLVHFSKYADKIRTGRYAVEPGDGAFTVFRHLKNGLQSPVNLVVPSVRTVDRLASELSKRLMVDSADIYNALTDEATCKKYGYDTTTIAAMFIPNTYDIYWNVSVDKLLDRMKKECGNFWNKDRMAKAKSLKLSPVEVSTLASIIDEETANNGEKPIVAGMYYNRLMLRDAEYPDGMPLQADPTIKFAWKRFDLKRIYNNLLHVNSPYNTYVNPGLPPGPIRIPSIAGIDAVLNLVRHDYLYMCAKEDFSGTHNFARNYNEHLQNARRYSQALNQRGIK